MNNYEQSIIKLGDFKCPTDYSKQGGVHDNIIDVYCAHLLDVARNLSEKKEQKSIIPENTWVDEEEISRLSKEYYNTLKENKLPIILAKKIGYTAEFSGEFLEDISENGYKKIVGRKSGEIDVMCIIPMELVCGQQNGLTQEDTYCLLGEIKSVYQPGTRPFEQVLSATYGCMYPHFKDPFNIKIIDGFLVTPNLTERIHSHQTDQYTKYTK